MTGAVDPPMPETFLRMPRFQTSHIRSETPEQWQPSVDSIVTSIVEHSDDGNRQPLAGKSQVVKRRTGCTKAIGKRPRTKSPSGVAMPDANGAETRRARERKPSQKIREGGGWLRK